MSKKILAYLASGLLLLGMVAGLGAYKAQAAGAAGPAVAQDVRQEKQNDAQSPAYDSSVRTNNPQDAGEAKGTDNEALEESSLQPLAKISPEEANAAALKDVPGKVTGISLDNENGNVVYSVKVQTEKGFADVKVDAGNGRVLARDSGDVDGSEPEDGPGGPDNDNIQLEE